MPLDGSLTFEDLIVRVAEPGMTSHTTAGAGIPTAAHDLAQCKRWVNDGRQSFYRSMLHVHAGWIHRPVSLTIDPSAAQSYSIDNQPWRVRLPWWCTGPLGSASWWWDDGSGGRGQAVFMHVSHVDLLIAQQGASSPPRAVAILPLPPSADEPDSARQGWELRVGPKPDRAVTITGQVLAGYQPMAKLSERDPAGSDHDMAIVAWARAERHRHDPDLSRARYYIEQAERETARSVALESAKRPSRSGVQPSDPAIDAYDVLGDRTPYLSNRVSSVDGVPVME